MLVSAAADWTLVKRIADIAKNIILFLNNLDPKFVK